MCLCSCVSATSSAARQCVVVVSIRGEHNRIGAGQIGHGPSSQQTWLQRILPTTFAISKFIGSREPLSAPIPHCLRVLRRVVTWSMVIAIATRFFFHFFFFFSRLHYRLASHMLVSDEQMSLHLLFSTPVTPRMKMLCTSFFCFFPSFHVLVVYGLLFFLIFFLFFFFNSILAYRNDWQGVLSPEALPGPPTRPNGCRVSVDRYIYKEYFFSLSMLAYGIGYEKLWNWDYLLVFEVSMLSHLQSKQSLGLALV